MADRSNQCLENLIHAEAATQAESLLRTRHADYPSGPRQNAHQQAGYMFAVEPNLHLRHLAKPGTFIHACSWPGAFKYRSAIADASVNGTVIAVISISSSIIGLCLKDSASSDGRQWHNIMFFNDKITITSKISLS